MINDFGIYLTNVRGYFIMETKKVIVKKRLFYTKRKTIYYYSDGSKKVVYWQSTDEFCNEMGI